MTRTYRGRTCNDLLAFEEVAVRLHLGTRLTIGRREVTIADIVGSVGRTQDFDGCFRPRTKRLREEIAERAANASTVDQPISLIQVDHAYFVEDGHKRLSAAIAAGRREVDADVAMFETDVHVGRGVTIESIRVTSQERRFRATTGLDRAVPRTRFALTDPDGYLELEESVKAHTLDLSHMAGRLYAKEEGARHWYDMVYRPILELVRQSDACRLLDTLTDADRFLLFRKGIEMPMDFDWRIPDAAVRHGRANLDREAAGGVSRRIRSLARRPRPTPELLPHEASLRKPD
jgi:hypothetical protein